MFMFIRKTGKNLHFQVWAECKNNHAHGMMLQHENIKIISKFHMLELKKETFFRSFCFSSPFLWIFLRMKKQNFQNYILQ